MTEDDNKVTQLQPKSVQYRGHTINITHRENVNDYVATFVHTRTVHITNKAGRHDSVVKAAKKQIDAFLKFGEDDGG